VTIPFYPRGAGLVLLSLLSYCFVADLNTEIRSGVV
jgi:hypothetical protein